MAKRGSKIADLERENAELRRQLAESAAQQTATAEVLGVINASPGDLTPVFEAMLEKALNLCDAVFGVLWTYDGERVHMAAHRGEFTWPDELIRRGLPTSAEAVDASGRLLRGEPIVHITDITQDIDYNSANEPRRLLLDAGARSLLAVPLWRDSVFLGYFAIYRRDVRPFTDKQIALLQNFAAQAGIAMENARLLTETREALEQQTATAEVLGVINASPGDLAPVFDAILERAHTLCGAAHGHLTIYDGERFRAVAIHGVPEPFAALLRRPFRPGLDVADRLLTGDGVIQIPDMAALDYGPEDEIGRAAVEKAGIRTLLIVPLRKDSTLLGYITAHRVERRPFSDKEIALLQNFAAQAVIAMENARLITETREALEQQTATAEVLQVINSSAFDLKRVFDTLVHTAARLCAADMAMIFRPEKDNNRLEASHGFQPAYEAFLRDTYMPSGRGRERPRESITGRTFEEGRVVHVHDVATDPAFGIPEAITLGKMRTALGVPLLRDGEPVGVIALSRHRVEPFTERQIELVRTFADQAVIAMENARLITETREALEQQTATAEVLQVINASPGDLTPVFDVILEKALKLCDAVNGHLYAYDGELLHPLAAQGEPRFVEWMQHRQPFRPAALTPLGRLFGGEPIVHFADALTDGAFAAPELRALVDIGNIRTTLIVGLRKDDVLLGSITVFRQEVRPFTDQQITLLESFAAQAVIAMENARLITETREALEQQTATAEVLGVINSSPGDLVPVFDAILEKAHSLCGVSHGSLQLYDDGTFRAVAVHSLPGPLAERLRQGYNPGPKSPIRRLLEGDRFVHIPDMAEIDDPVFRSVVELSNMRTFLSVALRKDDRLLGQIVSARNEVRPFADKEIALLQNFAAQAVIAMENARLITETRDALGQQTATAEVLQVINSSPGDLKPVFDAMLDKAMHLCEAAFGMLWTYDGEQYHPAALHGTPPAFTEFLTRGPITAGPETGLGQLTRERRVIHIPDIAADKAYEHADPLRVASVELGGGRSFLAVPLLRDEELAGAFVIYRQEVRPFTDKQIALVSNFAAQAVIATENARLLTETREALDRQTATSDILRTIAAAPDDAEGTLRKIAETTSRLFEACGAAFRIADGNEYHLAIGVGRGAEEVNAALYGRSAAAPQSVRGRALPGTVIRENRQIHLPDLDNLDPAIADWPGPPILRAAGIRTLVGTPLRREGRAIGALIVYRDELRPFTDDELLLLQSFADQAAIAIENARLLSELRDRTADLTESLEYQTATSDVLKVISRSTFDLQPVLDTVVDTARRLCEAEGAGITIRDSEVFRYVAVSSLHDDFYEVLRTRPFVPGRDTMAGRVALEGKVVHIPDITVDPEYALPEAVTVGKIRTLLGVPLLRDGIVVGTLGLTRQRVEPFSERQIELVQTFADQAVIAIENARLLSETREALDQQTATAEVLRVISGAATDLQPVFEAIVERASKLCEAEFSAVARLEDGLLRLVAVTDLSKDEAAAFHSLFPREPNRGFVMGRAFVDCQPTHVEDVLTDPDYDARTREVLQSLTGYRTFLAVPILREGEPIGVIGCGRRDVKPFSSAQIELVTTFADQAVIAIENTRLITETRQARDSAEGSLKELKSAQANLIQAEKMASLGQLTAGIAHEIKNPLNFVNNFASLSNELLGELKDIAAPAIAALDEDKRAELDETMAMLSGNLDKIAEHGRRADGIVKSMLAHSRGGSGERQTVDLNALLDESLNLAYHGARAQDQSFNITLERDFDKTIEPIELVPQDITRVFLNLFGNGFYAANKRAHANGAAGFRPVLHIATHDLGNGVEIKVRDNGTGIPPAIRDKLFQPFFTTKPTGEGTGLGLSISYDIVTQQHGGTIAVDSEEGQFTEFTIRLPRGTAAATLGAAH